MHGKIIKKASCPICDQEVELPDDVQPGNKINCCGKEFIVTYEWGSYALE
ncbi:sulfonate ABC transporter [Effusibacillus lacus]|uniref:Lysine biosynthesis protein LysW n=1 Tax=Effusibacillus lacus TaxID=1348429 RepID=A0A292YRU4_9BACL|nr:hypothetical protein EFBL_3339 [Effusibacillus lacus]